jgi:hypothetical protein
MMDSVLEENTWISSGICMEGNVVCTTIESLVQYIQSKSYDLSTCRWLKFLTAK